VVAGGVEARVVRAVRPHLRTPFLAEAFAGVNGRPIEKTVTMGMLSEEYWTFQYDDHDNLIAETLIRRSREVTTDEHGVVRSSKEEPAVQQHNQYSYQDDSRGNWTERVVSYRHGSQTAFQRSQIERRTITYYEP
jgi:hypothetical protein